MKPRIIRVLLVDDQTLFRQGLKAVLKPEQDIRIVGEATTGSEAITKVAALRPDLVLLEIMMSGADGLTTTRRIKQRFPTVHVLILTSRADPSLFQKAAEAGAVGYVLKDISPANLANGIRGVLDGRTILSPAIARQIVDHFFIIRQDGNTGGARPLHGLTQRNVDVLIGLGQGLSDKEIAAKLFLSESTVKTHLRAIYDRLKVHNRAQAAVYAVKHGLLKIP